MTRNNYNLSGRGSVKSSNETKHRLFLKYERSVLSVFVASNGKNKLTLAGLTRRSTKIRTLAEIRSVLRPETSFGGNSVYEVNSNEFSRGKVSRHSEERSRIRDTLENPMNSWLVPIVRRSIAKQGHAEAPEFNDRNFTVRKKSARRSALSFTALYRKFCRVSRTGRARGIDCRQRPRKLRLKIRLAGFGSYGRPMARGSP